MKKHAIVLAALFGATAAQAAQPAEAAQGPFYITAAAGPAHLSVDCTGATSCDTSGTGGKLMAGYSFGNGFSLEGGYISFGKARAADSTLSTTLKPSALVLGGAYALPFGSNWGMVVRLGVAQVKTKAEFATSTQQGHASERETKVVAGVGVTYAISSSVKLELGLDSTEGQFAGEKGNVRLISLGATFAF